MRNLLRHLLVYGLIHTLEQTQLCSDIQQPHVHSFYSNSWVNERSSSVH